jgi:hypothetical protein
MSVIGGARSRRACRPAIKKLARKPLFAPGNTHQTRPAAEVWSDVLRRITRGPPLLPEVRMAPDYRTILLAGRDPDLLLLRSAMLASAGIWSVRVCNAAQAEQVLEFVDCDLAILCYTLDETERQELTNVLLAHQKTVKVLSVAAGDDCCGTGFLRKVDEALSRPAAVPHAILEPRDLRSRMIR